MRWSGLSKIQISVSQSISGVCFLNSAKFGKAVTKIFPILQSFNIALSSITLFGDIGPCDVTTSIRNSHSFLSSCKTISGNLSCSVRGTPRFVSAYLSKWRSFFAVSPKYKTVEPEAKRGANVSNYRRLHFVVFPRRQFQLCTITQHNRYQVFNAFFSILLF